MFWKVNALTSKFKSKLHIIKTDSGEVITDPDKIAEHQKKYCSDLYRDHNGATGISTLFESLAELEPPPLKLEIEWSLRQTNSSKSPGPDNVPIELIKGAGVAGLELMYRVCVGVWETGKWPEDWKKSTFPNWENNIS